MGGEAGETVVVNYAPLIDMGSIIGIDMMMIMRIFMMTIFMMMRGFVMMMNMRTKCQ